MIPLDSCRADVDQAAIRRELDGIDDYIIQCFLKEFRVCTDGRNTIYRWIKFQCQLTRFQIRHIILLEKSQDRSDRHVFQMRGKYLAFESCHIQHAVDNLMQAVGALQHAVHCQRE